MSSLEAGLPLCGDTPSSPQLEPAAPVLAAVPKRRSASAKRTQWTDYDHVTLPADRVRYLQLCHNFLVSGTNSSGSSASSAMVDDSASVVFPRYDSVGKAPGHIATYSISPHVISTATHGPLATTTLYAPGSSTNSDHAVNCIGPQISGVVSACCTFCKRHMTAATANPGGAASSFSYAYCLPTAPRPLVPCCKECFRSSSSPTA